MTATPMTAGLQGSIYANEDGPHIVKERAMRTMRRIDAQPYPIRMLTHEYGWLAVDALIGAGVTRARHIEHIITTIRDRRGSTPVCDRLRAAGRLDETVRRPGEPTFPPIPTPTGRAEP